MIRSFLNAQIRKFGRRFNYDTSYMHEICAVSPGAVYGLLKLPEFYRYRGPALGQPVWTGALLASTLDGDCGPCAQLVIDMALAAGADRETLRLCAEGQADKAGAMGLGFRFAEAAIKADPMADKFRSEIAREFGEKCALSCAFAAV